MGCTQNFQCHIFEGLHNTLACFNVPFLSVCIGEKSIFIEPHCGVECAVSELVNCLI